MVDAESLIAETRQQLRGVEERLFAHPYLESLEAGRIPRDNLGLFAGEQFHIITSDLRSIGLLVSRHAQLPSRSYLLSLLGGEVSALEALVDFAAALGISEAQLQRHEPLAGCQAYPAYVAWLAAYGSDADFAAAFLVNLPAWGSQCGRMSAALRNVYGLPSSGVRFFDQFARPSPEFEADSLRVIQQGLERGLDPAGIARAARLIQAYELLYWDAILEASR